MKKCRLLLYLFALFWLVSGQSIKGQSPYVFHHLDTNEGLSNNYVKAILRDSYGFLWVGTESGLNRYDGYGFKVYKMQSEIPNTLISNEILGLQEDGLKNIWINLGYTYMVYIRDKDIFISDIEKTLSDIGIQIDQNGKVYIDKEQNIWVLNREKAFLYDIKKKRTSVFSLSVPLEDPIAINITDGDKNIYFVTKLGGCWKLNKNSGLQTKMKLPDSFDQSIANGSAKIYIDGNNWLWLYSTSTNQVFYQKKNSQKWNEIELNSEIKTESNAITSITENQSEQIWIGTDHKGVFVYDKPKDTVTNIVSHPWENSSISSNSIAYLYRDKNETIWIGHSKKGLSFYHESFRNFMNFKNSEYSDISIIMEDRHGNIWLGTDGQGLFVKGKKPESIARKLPVPNAAIVSLLEDSKGRVWIGTYQKGLFCYEDNKMIQYTTTNSKLTSNDVWGLKEDRYGNIWIGTLGGKIQVLPSGSDNFDFLISQFESNVYALDMFYDGGDKMYVATVYGLLVIDITNNKRVTYYGNKEGTQQFNQYHFSNVYKDERDILWLGYNNGLNIWDQKKDTLYYFDKEKGLCDNTIRGIIGDNLNKIWVATSNGLSILTVNRDLNDNLVITSKNYSVKDGLMNNYFNNHAIYKLSNGDILLGSVDGYTMLNPNKMAEKNQPMAKVIFTGLTVGTQNIEIDSLYKGNTLLKYPMEFTSNLTFNHNDKLISFQFTTGELLNADKVKYAYKIEGFNSQWIQTQENKITFSTLPPGDYKLFIKASNSDGVWSNDAKELTITVLPPFYFSGWAFVIYSLVAMGIFIYFIHRSKELNLKKIEQHRLKMDREKEIHINEIKLKFFTNISHDLRTPLTLMITPLQIMLNEVMDIKMKKKLSTINKNAHQLLSLINSLLDFRKLDVGIETLNLKSGDFVSLIRDIYQSFCVYAEERNIDLSITKALKSLPMQFDHDKIEKSLTNILSNAFKYTPDGGSINIHVYKQENNICVAISDSGPGIDTFEKELVFERFYQAQQKPYKTGSGIGLHIAKEYLNLHNGTIAITDNRPHGCIFTMTLPFRKIEEAQDASIHLSIEDTYTTEDYENNGVSVTRPVLLFVDDNKDFCEFMEDNLGSEYTVITAHNGQEALEQLPKYDVTIIVSDVMMPVMSGTELCKAVKTNIYWSHIPVILLTARTAEEYQLEGLELGADDYITKPFNFNLLKLRIQKFIEWTERSHNAFSQKIDVAPSEITITSLDEILIGKAIKVVEAHMSDSEFSVEILGEAVGLSRGHLYKKLKIITGKGPAEFIRTIRLKRGLQLLEKSQLLISEIAYEVGFNSPRRFSKYFQEEFGMSPSDYLRGRKQ